MFPIFFYTKPAWWWPALLQAKTWSNVRNKSSLFCQ